MARNENTVHGFDCALYKACWGHSSDSADSESSYVAVAVFGQISLSRNRRNEIDTSTKRISFWSVAFWWLVTEVAFRCNPLTTFPGASKRTAKETHLAMSETLFCVICWGWSLTGRATLSTVVTQSWSRHTCSWSQLLPQTIGGEEEKFLVVEQLPHANGGVKGKVCRFCS